MEYAERRARGDVGDELINILHLQMWTLLFKLALVTLVIPAGCAAPRNTDANDADEAVIEVEPAMNEATSKDDSDIYAGILNRLHAMYRAGEPMAEIQFDFYAISTFDINHRWDGLSGWLFNPDGRLIFQLPESMARRGFERTAEILDRVRSLFPREAWDVDYERLYPYLADLHANKSDEISRLSDEMWDAREDYQSLLDAIFHERRDELPEPYYPEPRLRWKRDPFLDDDS